MYEEAAAAMEHSLEFVGITAVEDRLQDGVPHAIKTIRSLPLRLEFVLWGC